MLSRLFGSGELEELRTETAKRPFRRLTEIPETEVNLEVLCQSVHVGKLNGAPELSLGQGPSGYYTHSVVSAMREIDALKEIGIRRIFLQMLPFAPEDHWRKRLDDQSGIIRRLKDHAGPNFEITVHPLGLCMRSDLKWGVTAKCGGVDLMETLELLATSAVAFGQAGADTFCTIGRINQEVEVVRRAVESLVPNLNIMSFSTNSETPNAYIHQTRDNASLALTGQKIILGNTDEMILRALLDVGEGTQLMVQKPMEGFHVQSQMRDLLDRPGSIHTFLQRPAVRSMLEQHPRVAERMESLAKRFPQVAPHVRLGAYEVSGSYWLHKVLAEKTSPRLAFNMLDEVYKNVVAANRDRLETIIGRSVSWYARMRSTEQENRPTLRAVI